MKIYTDIFNEIISLNNLFMAWDKFKIGKSNKKDIIEFEFNLEKNLMGLHRELENKSYSHGPYKGFYTQDPKQRHIHKALVKDRVVHHAIFSILYPIFEETFIYDSYSCRLNKGAHKGIYRMEKILRKISKNNRKSCFILKCDVRKFFASVNHEILKSLISRRVKDNEAMRLINNVIKSFPSGIPIGNLTSQLFANIYLNELDQFIKQQLRIPFYLRYTDDFVIIHSSKDQLGIWLDKIKQFLSNNLKLELHPQKVILHKYHQGIDFLGYLQFPNHRILRTKTKRRILSKAGAGISEQSLQSYLGVLSHADEFNFSEKLKNLFWITKNPPSGKDK